MIIDLLPGDIEQKFSFFSENERVKADFLRAWGGSYDKSFQLFWDLCYGKWA